MFGYIFAHPAIEEIHAACAHSAISSIGVLSSRLGKRWLLLIPEIEQLGVT